MIGGDAVQLVTFYDGSNTIDISLAKDAGYAFPLPFMPVVVDMLTLTTPVDEAVMAIKNTRLEFEHLALSVEAGKADLYYRGHKILSASTGAFTVTGFELGEGLHSEHILSPKTARPEDISTWSNMRSPFFDPSPVIPDSQIPSAGKWDSKVTTFYGASQPSANAVGDIWYDTSDNNHPYRWDANQWVDIQDKSPIPDERIPSADKWDRKARTFFQSTAPTATGIGDIWFDTSDHHKRYWWDGSTWQGADQESF